MRQLLSSSFKKEISNHTKNRFPNDLRSFGNSGLDLWEKRTSNIRSNPYQQSIRIRKPLERHPQKCDIETYNQHLNQMIYQRQDISLYEKAEYIFQTVVSNGKFDVKTEE